MQPIYHEGWAPAVHVPGYILGYNLGWDQPPQPHEARGSGWQSADNTEWAQGTQWQPDFSYSEGLPPPVMPWPSVSDRRELDSINTRLGRLEIRTGEV